MTCILHKSLLAAEPVEITGSKTDDGENNYEVVLIIQRQMMGLGAGDKWKQWREV